jgi:AraC-like DNA-binding protein
VESDPFSDILAFANASSAITGGWTCRGAWALRFPKPTKLKFFAFVRGGAWVVVDGAEPLQIEAGDVVSLSAAQRSFVITNDLSLAPLPSHNVFTPGANAIVRIDAFTGVIERRSPPPGLISRTLPPGLISRTAPPGLISRTPNALKSQREISGPLPKINPGEANGRSGVIGSEGIALPKINPGGDEGVDGALNSEDFVLGGHVDLDASSGGLLAEVLPPLIHVRAASPQASVVRWLLSELVRERQSKQPGAAVASNQLAQLMFVQLMRVHLASSEMREPGLLRAISDRRIAPALWRMHDDPGRAWQLGELAQSCAMSRTTFALHFKEIAGVPPFTYLTWWRMRLAERELREGKRTVSELSRTLGYSSESAFSNAFKRVNGVAPKRYRSAARRSSH